MKIWVIAFIFLFLVLLAPFSSAKTKTVILDRGDSYVMENVNVTLIDYRKRDDKVLICVDNERAIISDEKRVGMVYFEIRSFRDDGVKLTLDADCDDCVVSDNSECFPVKTIAEEEARLKTELTEKNESAEVENISNSSGDEEKLKDLVEKQKKIKDNYNGIFKRLILALLDLFR